MSYKLQNTLNLFKSHQATFMTFLYWRPPMTAHSYEGKKLYLCHTEPF